MTLERTLTELQTLVEYGCGYLKSRNLSKIHPLEILPQMHKSDLLTYVLNHNTFDSILDEMNIIDDAEIDRWIRCNRNIGEIGFDDEDIKDYVAENWDVDDVFDDYDIKDYVRDNLDMEDVYDGDYLEDKARDMVDDMSLSEILDIKDMSDEDVLDCLPNSSITDYVAERFNVGDVYDADDICDYVRDDLGLHYFLDGVSLDEFMESKDMSTKDVLDELDEDITYVAQNMVEDMSIGEFLDVKGSYKELYDFVTENFALADWVQWKDECTSYVNG